MRNRITFEHSTLSTGQHVISSPDVNGFRVIGAPGASLAVVQRQALEVLQLMRSRKGAGHDRLSAVEYEAA